MPTDEGKRNEMNLALNSVISILIDSQKGFADIGEHITDAKLKQFFLTESLKRASFRGDLEEILHQNRYCTRMVSTTSRNQAVRLQRCIAPGVI